MQLIYQKGEMKMILSRLIRKMLCRYSIKMASSIFDGSSNEILLTFDDGPHPDWTPKILDLLYKNNIKSIFFVVGENGVKYPDLVRRIVADGHYIGNHTYGHEVATKVKHDEFISSYQKCEKVIISNAISQSKFFFRPPCGLLRFWNLVYFIFKRTPLLLWSCDSQDSKFLPIDKTIEKIASSLSSKTIFLFHDDSGHTLEILKIAIPLWLNNGFSFPVLHNGLSGDGYI